MKPLSIILSIFFIAGLSVAAVIHVPGDYTTIQAGINAAVDGDTVMIADGTYTGTGNKDLDFTGKEITVMSENGPANCTINCQGSGKGFWFHYGETNSAVVDGLRIIQASSGGIFIYNSQPIIRNCIIEDCNSRGISCSIAQPCIEYCQINDNNGGLYLSSSDAEIYNCTIYGNNTSTGGAAYAYNCSPVFNSCIIAWNTVSG
ncbi:right-handed parallel beta-helix repeat-containing protein [bacterium]|nr:right-handed parallel beta-helix repeat-containing protein [bacterium]